MSSLAGHISVSIRLKAGWLWKLKPAITYTFNTSQSTALPSLIGAKQQAVSFSYFLVIPDLGISMNI